MRAQCDLCDAIARRSSALLATAGDLIGALERSMTRRSVRASGWRASLARCGGGSEQKLRAGF
jgi:hypothetical protein